MSRDKVVLIAEQLNDLADHCEEDNIVTLAEKVVGVLRAAATELCEVGSSEMHAVMWTHSDGEPGLDVFRHRADAMSYQYARHALGDESACYFEIAALDREEAAKRIAELDA